MTMSATEYENRFKEKTRAYLEVHGYHITISTDDPNFWNVVKRGLYELTDAQLREMAELMQSGGWAQ